MEPYYSFDLGGWHIVALNSGCSFSSGCSRGPQERWLVADLAADSNRCSLSFSHQPHQFRGGMATTRSTVSSGTTAVALEPKLFSTDMITAMSVLRRRVHRPYQMGSLVSGSSLWGPVERTCEVSTRRGRIVRSGQNVRCSHPDITQGQLRLPLCPHRGFYLHRFRTWGLPLKAQLRCCRAANATEHAYDAAR